MRPDTDGHTCTLAWKCAHVQVDLQNKIRLNMDVSVSRIPGCMLLLCVCECVLWSLRLRRCQEVLVSTVSNV